MPKYIATEKAYDKKLGLINPGQEFEWEGEPGPWMIPVDSKKKTPVLPKENSIEDEPIYAAAERIVQQQEKMALNQPTKEKSRR